MKALNLQLHCPHKHGGAPGEGERVCYFITGLIWTVPMALSLYRRDLHRNKFRCYKTNPGLRLWSMKERWVLWKARGVASVISCNYGFQPVAKRRRKAESHRPGTYINQKHGKHLSPNLPANRLCSKITQGGEIKLITEGNQGLLTGQEGTGFIIILSV